MFDTSHAMDAALRDPVTQERAFDSVLHRLASESERMEAIWRHLHRYDPCKSCGNLAEVEIVPIGGMARLTPLCRKCRERMTLETRLHHEGWDIGFRAGWREAMERPWWRRLWGPKVPTGAGGNGR